MTKMIRLSMDMAAEPQAACKIISDWCSWPETFSRTIEGVSMLSRTADSLTLQVRHKTDGVVVNILKCDEDGSIQLREFKPRYDAKFTFFCAPGPLGARLHVHGSIWLKGWSAWFGCLAGPLIRSRVRRFLLEPIRVRAEASGSHASAN